MVEQADLDMYGQHDLPSPLQCVNCRLRHLFSFWVFGKFRKTVSALSGKSLITVVSDTVKFPLYDREEFISDAWDPLQYGQTYDPNKPFFEQFRELMNKVPHPHQLGTNNTNCQWADDVWSSRECYLCRSLVDCEFLSYAYRVVNCKNSIDITYCFDTELSYDCLYCFKSYKLHYSYNCRDCVDSKFLYDCRNVQNSFMCWNLRNKQYCILNQQYTKEEYAQKLKEFDVRSYASIQKLKQQFWELVANEAVHRENFNVQAANSSGNFLSEVKNCSDCRFLEKSENCRHMWRGFSNKDEIDVVGDFNSEKNALSSLAEGLYECVGILSSSHCRYSRYLDYCQDVEYCFGCAGLKKKKFCILNTQYSEDEYKALVATITENMKKAGEWGKFFPSSFASAGYNLSLAQIHFPDTRENVESRGGYWQDLVEPTHDGVSGDQLPDRVDAIAEEFTKQAIICPETKWRYNVSPRELSFYKENGIPLPRRHPDWRTLNRFKPMALAMNPQKGICCYCAKPITHYFPDSYGYKKIACVECYQKEIV